MHISVLPVGLNMKFFLISLIFCATFTSANAAEVKVENLINIISALKSDPDIVIGVFRAVTLEDSKIL